MAVMSFAHLKNKKSPGREIKPPVQEIKKPSQNTQQIKPDSAFRGTAMPNNFHLTGSLVGVDLNASILATRFCYGCIQFSVDAPMSERERAYCLRKGLKGEDYEFIFKRIKSTIAIRQCPLVKHTQG